MIVVAGEALVDLILELDGSVDVALGGAPYNTARAAARLGAPVTFVGRLSSDRFGGRLAQQLHDDGVEFDAASTTTAPTTLAAAEIDATGAAQYRFYFAGTSAPALDADVMSGAVDRFDVADDAGVFFAGGLGLVLEPMATSIVAQIESLSTETLCVLDVNCRPAVVENRDAYVSRLRHAVRRADIVKVSDEDLEYLSPGAPTLDAARELLDGGARVVLVTAGASHTTVIGPDSQVDVAVPTLSSAVVDTVGAGDTFGGGVLAWWSAAGCGRADVSVERVAMAVAAGHLAAGIVVTRRGANPPTLTELLEGGADWPS